MGISAHVSLAVRDGSQISQLLTNYSFFQREEISQTKSAKREETGEAS